MLKQYINKMSSTIGILCLFVDTNLFIQCRDLSELDWSEWKDFSEVWLIVSLPVQREIDKQKTRGNDRVGQRARKTYSSIFRPIATGRKEYQIINEAGPQVKLFLEAPSRPDPELAGSLDYSRPDDEIIGCLSRFTKDHPDIDARLLTHDTGPIMIARGFGLSVSPISDNWILPPENNDREREITRLKQEVARLKNAEPTFDIRCVNTEGAEISVLELIHRIYSPLNEEEVSRCMDLIERKFPVETEFNHRGRIRPTVTLGRQSYFEPASEEDIRNYQENEYPKWLDACREWLIGIHELLQRKEGSPRFTFEVANIGSRPGNDALLIIRAKGNFTICPPPYITDEFEEPEEMNLHVPSPPKPPQGRWQSSFGSLMRMFAGLDTLGTIPSINTPALARPLVLPRTPRRDPNAFYYKPTPITEPAGTFSLECEQWRHGTSGELFAGDIVVVEGLTEISGALECEIHAENLFEPALKRIPVKIKIEYGDSMGVVEKVINPPLD